MKIIEMDELRCVVEPDRKVYINSLAGRAALAADSHNIKNYNEMIEIWGDEPTVVPEQVKEISLTDEQARAKRRKLLLETDWTQTLDAPISTASKEAFRVYRQALRDVPQQADYPNTINWPVKPEAVKADPEPVDNVVDAIIGEEGLE